MKKRVLHMAIVLSAGLLLAGCGSGGKKADEDYKKIVDDFAAVTLVQDQDNGDYAKALESVGVYLNDSTPESLKEAQTVVRETIEKMEEVSSSGPAYEMEPGFSELLSKYGFDPEEYQINADMRKGYLAGYIDSLGYLEYYLQNEGEGSVTRNSLEFTYQYDMEEQEDMKGFYYCGINYWFAEWGEEETAYVKQQVLDKMESFTVKDPVWENSRDAVERKLTVYLDNIEKHMDKWLDFIGENQEDLYEMEKQQRKKVAE